MTPFGDTSNQEDERNISAPPPARAKREIPERPTPGTARAIYRHQPLTLERVSPVTQRAHEEEPDDGSLVFDAIYDAFLAHPFMLGAFPQLRSEDGAESLW